MEIVEVKISDLKKAEYNPRKITDKEMEDLKESLKQFGFVEPVVVNSHKSRKNVIIGGHQRMNAWQQLGNETVPVFYKSCTKEKEKELNIRLNKSGGKFDMELLQEHFSVDDLISYGFEDYEFATLESQVELEDMFENNENQNEDINESLRIVLNYTEEEHEQVIEKLKQIGGSYENAIWKSLGL